MTAMVNPLRLGYDLEPKTGVFRPLFVDLFAAGIGHLVNIPHPQQPIPRMKRILDNIGKAFIFPRSEKRNMLATG